MVRGSCSKRPPEGARVSTVRRVPSRVSISICPLRGNGVGVLRVKVRVWESGRSSGLGSEMMALVAG